MGVLNKLKFKKVDDYTQFSVWLDFILKQDLPNGIIAYNFNVYEGNKNAYDIELIGSNEYDEEDEDWACTDYYSSGELLCSLKQTRTVEDWEDGLENIISLVKRYLSESIHADTLKKANVITVGFVDGDLQIVYKQGNII